MLYYSGYTRRIGGKLNTSDISNRPSDLRLPDVDEGSTVTDFLPAERARGITIQSAAITLQWPPGSPVLSSAGKTLECLSPRSSVPHLINLIDTPGHADFTFEVLRSLRVLDGAVCILDGVAGVEAQTEKVWTQANHYQIPRIVYINKLDRDGAAFGRTVKEIASRLRVWPALCQIPWWRRPDGKFCGIGDVINLRGLLWEENGDGRAIQLFSLEDLQSTDEAFAEELKRARVALVERLSEYNDTLVEKFFECKEDHLAIPANDIVEALRNCTLAAPQSIVPVFTGASFRNIGVQPLLDAILDLLPSPIERGDPEITLAGVNGNLGTLLSGGVPTSFVPPAKRQSLKALAANVETCALAFKVVNDPKRGVLVYVRVYSGSIKQGSQLFNTTLGLSEKAPKLLRMFASDATEILSIEKGHIGVIVGLKHTRTGDTLMSYTGMHPRNGPPEPFRSLQLRPIAVPPPVFFTSIEPISQSAEKQVSSALQLLLREDPSLNVSTDPESGQTLLAGMGELHLEIARERLIKDFNAKATAGKIEIGYREAVSTASGDCLATVDKEVAGKYVRANCIASVQPMGRLEEDVADGGEHARCVMLPDGNLFTVYHPTLTSLGATLNNEAVALPNHLTLNSIITALQAGTSAALARGPEYAYPVHSTNVKIHLDQSTQFFPNTTLGAIAMAARQAVQSAMNTACQTTVSALMEPVMHATITVHEADLGPVVQDITSARGGQVLSLGDDVLDTSNAAQHPGSTGDHLILDPKKAYAPIDPFSSSHSDDDVQFGGHRTRQITARVPLREMVGYLKHLRSLTGGRGTFIMQVDRFDRVTGQRLKRAIHEIKGL